jgi:hypothetical protein
MRVLGSTVLVFEWLIVALGVPVAVNSSGVSPAAAWVFLGVMTVLIVVAIATITRPFGVAVGWTVQVWILAAGIVVPLLLILGLVFSGLWFAAGYYARRVETLRAAHEGAADPSREAIGDTGTRLPVRKAEHD